MLQFIIRRIALAIPTILGVSLLVFLALHMMPSDPVRMLMTEHRAGEVAIASAAISEEQIEFIRKQLGLDRPLYVQFANFVWNTLRGDLGVSWRSGREVNTLIVRNLPYSLSLSIAGLIVATTLGITLGVFSAVHHRTWIDTIAMFFSVLGVSMPNFWLGIMLMLFLGIRLGLFPYIGASTPAHLILPALTLGLSGSALMARITRSSMLEILGQDYIRTARSKGLSERVVIAKHALRNAMIPVVTLIGLSLGTMLSGTIILENVFGRPGLGRLAVDGLYNNDFPVVQATVLLVAVSYVLANLLVDVSYGFVDPRIRYQ